MLTYLSLKNFKIWLTTGPIGLAPVTLFLGTNSSGKTSLFQSLLLLRQTVQRNSSEAALNFGNPERRDPLLLGTFTDVLSSHRVGKPRMSLEFRWREASANQDASFSAEYRKGLHGGAEIDSLRIAVEDRSFHLLRTHNGIYRLLLDKERKSSRRSPAFCPLRSFTLSDETIKDLGEHGKKIRALSEMLNYELSKIIYLGPIRAIPKRDYYWSGSVPTKLEDDGSNVPQIIIASWALNIRLAKRNDWRINLFSHTSRWLKEMGLADKIDVKHIGGSYYEILIERDGAVVNLKDVGVGVSQVLPVIVAALYAKPGHIVISEEPESHLHPLAQSTLANLFADISRERQVQFLIETHSEHLFRRMQTLIAKDDLAPKTDCRMYFVDKDPQNKSAVLKELVADEFGRISEWPSGFFGDALGETKAQMDAAFKRQLGTEDV